MRVSPFTGGVVCHVCGIKVRDPDKCIACGEDFRAPWISHTTNKGVKVGRPLAWGGYRGQKADEIKRLCDRITKADTDSELLGYARQIREIGR